MEIKVVKTQAELDAIPDDFDGIIRIEGGDFANRIIVNRRWGNSSVIARESSSVIARGNSLVEARENSLVVAWDNSSVIAKDNSSVVAWDNSSVIARDNSSVIARDNSSVEARGNSLVEAWDNSSVIAKENSSVIAWDNSSVIAWDNSSVIARDNSSVEARGNSLVEARENSLVVAWDNSSVIAKDNSSVIAWDNSSVIAWDNSSVIARDNSSVEARGNSLVEARENSSVALSRYAQVRPMSPFVSLNFFDNSDVRVIQPFDGVDDYVRYYNIQCDGEALTLYKAVHRKSDSEFEADRCKFMYRVGEKAKNRVNTNVSEDCGEGLHVSTLDFALNFGRAWNDLAIIECKVPKYAVVVPKYSTGKIRTSELTVVREVPLEECGVYGKILAKKRARNDK